MKKTYTLKKQITSFKNLLLGVLLCIFFMPSYAQCPDFMNIEAPNVTCYTGSTGGGPFQTVGISNGRHTHITSPGYDPYLGGNLLPMIPPGETQSIRLGNSSVGCQAEAIEYNFPVDANNPVLLLKFAVVLDDPHHGYSAQPRFIVRVLDANGNLVDPCAEYDVRAPGNSGPAIPGFIRFSSGWWRPWTNVGIDLTQYIGQTIKVQFITYDCGQCGHCGYAYFTAECIPNRLELTECRGDTVRVSAPPFFESYTWSDGSTGTETEFIMGDTTLRANCEITSATGCVFTLNVVVTPIPPTAIESEIHDTVCLGNGYSSDFFELPPQMAEGTFVYLNSLYTIDESGCEKMEDITLFLTVLPDRFSVSDEICQGENYDNHGFHITAEQIDALIESIPIQMLVYNFTFTTIINDYGCDQTVTLTLDVNAALQMPDEILGPTDPCTREEVTYILPTAGTMTSFNWRIPDGVEVVSGQGTPSITLYFRENADEEIVISMEGGNGCGNAALPLIIRPHRATYDFYQDTICTGSNYTLHGFNLPRQDSIGYYTYINSGQTAFGCDSFVTLALTVYETPVISTQAEPSILCRNEFGTESTIIEVVGDQDGIILTPPDFAIGDILCTDMTASHPGDWAMASSAGKVAMGIIFHVDQTGEHGWAVALGEANISNCTWAASTGNILFNQTTERAACAQYNGEGNTTTLANSSGGGFQRTYPAAYNAYHYDHIGNLINNSRAQGWFLPSAGQLRMLFANLPQIENTLAVVAAAGTTVQTFSGVGAESSYWSSTPASNSNAWAVEKDGLLRSDPKISGAHRVRAIISF